MADYTERFSEVLYPLTYEHADSQAAGSHASAWVCLANYHRAWFVLDVGDMAASATLNAQLWQATDTAGTGAKVITGKSITQLTQAGGDGNQLCCIELQTEELDVDGGFDCVKFIVTVGTDAVEYSAILYGGVPRFAPTATANWEEAVG